MSASRVVLPVQGQAEECFAWPTIQVPHGHKCVNIASATTTIVKIGIGVLHSITINKSVASTIEVYDNTAASGSSIALIAASVAAGTLTYDVEFSAGLTIKTNGASDLTISYR